jgi:hypothetical protein
MVLGMVAMALAGPGMSSELDRTTEAVGGVVGTHELDLRPTDPVVGSPVVVTHHELRFDLMASDVAPSRLDVSLRDLLGTPAADASAVPQLDRWSTARVNTGELCGMSAEVDWTLRSAGGPEADPVSVERVRFGGEVCPQFVDADADGRCPQGRDLDGDGQCVSGGEVMEQGTRMDCNDTARGPACLGLSIHPEAGATALVATGAPAGEPVWFFGSVRRGQSCPPTLGGVCVDLAMPRLLGVADADPEGTARLVTPGDPTGYYQVGVLRLGMDSDFSSALEATGVATVPEPATEP